MSEHLLLLKELHIFILATILNLCVLYRILQHILSGGYKVGCQLLPCSVL